MKFEIKNRWSGAVLYTCELTAEVGNRSYSLHLALAAKKAIASGANLSGANLRSADLSGTDLSGANLRSADLSGTDLNGTDLSGANLSGANLSGANLSGANLRSAYLGGANLRSAYLGGANLSGAVNASLVVAQTRILPEGTLIGWKKLRNDVIAKLRIPEDAKRSHAFGRKCRAEFVDVIEVIGAKVGVSRHDGVTKYEAGKRVHPDRFDETWTDECAPGIHFFITREEAEAY